jgi:hypothetical protein
MLLMPKLLPRRREGTGPYAIIGFSTIFPFVCLAGDLHPCGQIPFYVVFDKIQEEHISSGNNVSHLEFYIEAMRGELQQQRLGGLEEVVLPVSTSHNSVV